MVMKKQTTVLHIMLVMVLALTQLTAQAQPNWTVDVPSFQYTMTLTGVGLFDCTPTADPNDMVAAFIDGECRGVSAFDTEVDGQLFAYLTVYDNVAQGSEVTFKLYRASTDEEIEGPVSLSFSDGAIYGYVDDPFRFQTDWDIVDMFLTPDSLTDSDIQGMEVGEVFLVNEVNDTLTGNFSFVDDGLGVDNASFSFLTSFLILETDINFAVQDTFQIHVQGQTDVGCSYDEVLIIPVFNNNIAPNGLVEDSMQIAENQPISSLVGMLEADDDSANDTHTFSYFTTDTVNLDFDAFELDGADLLTTLVLDYEDQVWYSLEVKVTDAAGNSVVDTLTIEVLDEIEYDDLKTSNLITPDNDGHNDFLMIPNVALFQDFTLYVYNAMGSEVYSTTGYDNTWDGVANNGSELPSATYYYVLRNDQDSSKQFKGDIHIYRSNKF